MSKPIIKCIKEYFKTCPYLSELAKINVDYLNPDSKDHEYWSIEPMGVPVIIKKNVLGTKTTRQCQFVLASRVFFNPLDDTQNIENLQVFADIAEWLYQNDKNHIFPELNEDEKVKSIEVLIGGALYGTNKDNTIARYQMNCKLIYEKKEG